MEIEVVSLDAMLESGDADVDQFDLLATEVIIPNYNKMASLYSKIEPGSDYTIARRSDGNTRKERIKNNRKSLKRVWDIEYSLRLKIEDLKKEEHILIQEFKSYGHPEVKKVGNRISPLYDRLESLEAEKIRLGREYTYLTEYYNGK